MCTRRSCGVRARDLIALIMLLRKALAALQRRCMSQQPLRKTVVACRGLSELESSSDEVKRVFDLDMTSEVERSKAKINELIGQFQQCPGDTGSTPVQIAILTFRIKHLTEHMKRNRKDYCCQRSLVKMVYQRRRLLQYLQRKDYSSYQLMLSELELRAPKQQHYPSKPT